MLNPHLNDVVGVELRAEKGKNRGQRQVHKANARPCKLLLPASAAPTPPSRRRPLGRAHGGAARSRCWPSICARSSSCCASQRRQPAHMAPRCKAVGCWRPPRCWASTAAGCSRWAGPAGAAGPPRQRAACSSAPGGPAHLGRHLELLLVLYPNPSRRKRPRRAPAAPSTHHAPHEMGAAARLEAPQPVQGAQNEEDTSLDAGKAPQAALQAGTPFEGRRLSGPRPAEQAPHLSESRLQRHGGPCAASGPQASPRPALGAPRRQLAASSAPTGT